MELRYLFEFCILAEIGNFLEAADELDMSQSTLSRHLSALEMEFGVPLFIRTTRRTKISQFGKILLTYANQLLKLEQELFNDINKIKNSSDTKISIGSVPAMIRHDITNYISPFFKKNTHVTFEIIEEESANLKEMVRNGTIDFAFIREEIRSKHEFVSITIKKDKLAAVIPASHPLAESKNIPLIQFKDENFLLLAKGTLMYKLCMNTCNEAGFDPKICYTSHRADNIIDLVAKGMGIALLNNSSVDVINNIGVVTVSINPSIETNIDLIYLKERAMSKNCLAFLQFLTIQQ